MGARPPRRRARRSNGDTGRAPRPPARLRAHLAGLESIGYVRASDYARERLGLSGRSLYDLARVGTRLPRLPRLAAALVSGVLPWSKVRMLARFVQPSDEAAWIDRARNLGVRELERHVRAVDRGALVEGAPACDEEGHVVEPVETVRLRVGSALCFKWQDTQAWAARVAGEPVSPGAALEMITAEALSALPLEPGKGLWAEASSGEGSSPERPSDAIASNPRAAVAGTCAADDPSEDGPIEVDASNVCHAGRARPRRPGLRHSELPAFLQPFIRGLDEADPFELDARLRRAVRLEQRLDAEIAGLLRRVYLPDPSWRGHPRTLASFAREQLGMSPRKARALVRLERVAETCPSLRAAWRDGAISWVQAQILMPLLVGGDDEGPSPGWREAWILWAQSVTVRRLEAAVDQAVTLREASPDAWLRCREDPERASSPSAVEPSREAVPAGRQTCAPPTSLIQGIRLRVSAPPEVARLFRAVLCSLRRTVEAETGRLPGEAEAFEAMIDHALRSWGVRDPRLRGRRAFAVFERDGWRCTIPGCSSLRNLHAHHIRFRSAGGSDDPGNLTTLCAAHHHRGVHAGVVRVGGNAPDALWFELGARSGQAPLARFRSGDRVA